jgi:hypothetical protein
LVINVPVDFLSYSYNRTYTKGMFSWWVPRTNMSILSFDMSNEVFLITPVSYECVVGYCHLKRIAVFVLNESVALVVLENGQRNVLIYGR